VTLGLVTGLTVGLALACLGGARRTASAYERFLVSAEAPELTMESPEGADDATFRAELVELQGVERVSLGAGAAVLPADPELLQTANNSQAVVSIDGRWFTSDRPAVIEGRLADPDDSRQVMVNERAAEQFDVGVGDLLPIQAVTLEQMDEVLSGRGRGVEFDMRVAGIVVLSEGVVEDDIGREGMVILTPAWYEANPDFALWRRWGVHLSGGSGAVPALAEEIARRRPETSFVYQSLERITEKAQRALRPQVVALGAFGLVIGVAALLVLSPILARRLRWDEREERVLSAIGVTPRGHGLLAAAGAAVVAGTAVVAAAVTAVALSPLFPVGAVRRVEPDPGVDLDGVVLGIGLPVLALALALPALVAATRAGGSRLRSARARPSAVVSAAGWLGGPSTTIGVRQAMRSGPAAGISSRLAVGGVAIAVGALAATLTFGGSLHRLVERPSLYGWNWDVAMHSGSGWNTVDTEPLLPVLQGPDVAGWSSVMYADPLIDGAPVPTMILDRERGDVLPPLREGRAPAAADEVALGRHTMARLGVGIGDEVEVTGGDDLWTSTVVGEAVMPAIGRADVERAGLGIGAMFDQSVLPPEVNPQRHAVLVRFLDGADQEPLVAALREGISRAEEGGEVLPVQRPADIVHYDEMRAAPTAIAGVLAVAAAGIVLVVLMGSVRRSRRDLAVLRSLGFLRRQLRATVVWNALTIALLAGVVGLPLGVAIGRSSWMAFGNAAGVVTEPAIPPSIVLLGVGTVALAVATAVVPARRAATVQPASELRNE
jgi:hypothetical protein